MRSDRNVLRRNTVIANQAFWIEGADNVLRGNTVPASFYGIDVGGARPRLIGNAVVESGGSRGITLAGGSTGNVIALNRAAHAIDFNGDCAHNRWLANAFEMADPPCILEGWRGQRVSQR